MQQIDSVKDIVVFASGNGSNFLALARNFKTRIALLIVNDPSAPALQIAERFSIATAVIEHGKYQTRALFEDEIMCTLGQTFKDNPLKLVLLAGFMRVLSPHYFKKMGDLFPHAETLNIHPAHLFEYKGPRGYLAAIQSKAPRWGISVHRVIPELDSGEVIASYEDMVFPYDNEDSLRERFLPFEHALYVESVSKILKTDFKDPNQRTQIKGLK